MNILIAQGIKRLSILVYKVYDRRESQSFEE